MLNVEDIEEINREQLVTPLDRLLFRGELMTRRVSVRRSEPVPVRLPMVMAFPDAPQPDYGFYLKCVALFTVACFVAMLAVMASRL